MDLLDLINRPPVPEPWSEGGKIPWNEPAFSARMLKEHLNQSHDAASRRGSKIRQHIAWIHHEVLSGQPARILDLGCGPGLYTSGLAQLGHDCTGIDFSPASIAYAAAFAADQAETTPLKCTYHLQDIRTASYGRGFQMVMLIFGEFNTFNPRDAAKILEKSWQALQPGGFLVLEPHTFEAVKKMGMAGCAWYSSKSGLFSDKPHVCLMESFWIEAERTAVERYFILEAGSHNTSCYAMNTRAYERSEIVSMLSDCGFEGLRFYPSLSGEEDESQADLFALVARKCS